MRGSCQNDRHDRGFTLIEVMVALTICLVAMVVLFDGIASSLRAAHKTAARDRAITRAESRLASLGALTLVPGERSGDDGDGYRWQTRIAFLGAAPAPPTVREGPWLHGTGLYAVSVIITWNDGRLEQRLSLDSARLGTLPSSGP
jgi:prepilin-type N-terminal cleavage/methylation domain-containing protein